MSTDAPAWSPDGRWVAFEGGPSVYARQRIYVVRPDGSGRRNLIDGADPTWSPDGERIAFVRGGRARGIWKIGADGCRPVRLHPGWAPAWSSDGRRIAFNSRACSKCQPQVYVMDANGDNARQVTTGRGRGASEPQRAEAPAWSPDGKLIAFSVLLRPRGHP